MTHKLRPGVYEDMITAALEAEINARREDGWRVDVHPADATSRPEFLARHVYELLRRALESIHGDDDAQVASQVALANRLVEALFEHGAMADDRVAEAARLLIEAADRRGLGEPPPPLPRPTLSFRRTGLLVNGRRDVQIASEIAREIPSADRIDLLCAFVRHSGLRLFRSELEARARAGAQVRVGEFMHEAGAELEDIYAKPQSGHCFVELRRRAGFSDGAGAFDSRDPLLRAVGRLLHVDDHERLAAWRAILESEGPDPISSLRGRGHRLGVMLFAILRGRRQSTSQADSVLQGIRESVELRREINDLLDILDDRIRTVAQPLDVASDVPLASNATYSLGEIAAAHGHIDKRGALVLPQAGVL